MAVGSIPNMGSKPTAHVMYTHQQVKRSLGSRKMLPWQNSVFILKMVRIKNSGQVLQISQLGYSHGKLPKSLMGKIPNGIMQYHRDKDYSAHAAISFTAENGPSTMPSYQTNPT